MLSAKQEGVKYHLLSLYHDSTFDRTPVSEAISEHSTHKANGPQQSFKTIIFECKLVHFHF